MIRETDAEAIRLARTLLRTARYGALAVLDPQRARRWQAGSQSPPISTARRSSWCRRCRRTPARSTPTRAARCLLGEPGKGDPLAHPRISIRCRARRLRARHAGAGARRAALSQPPSQGQALCRLRRFRLLPSGGGARQPQWRLRQGLSPARDDLVFDGRQTSNSPCRAAGARPHERRPSRCHRRLCARLRQGDERWLVAHRHRRRRHRHRFAATTAGGCSSPNRSAAQENCATTLVGLAQQGRRSIAQPPD